MLIRWDWIAQRMEQTQLIVISRFSLPQKTQRLGKDERLADYMKKIGYEELGFGYKYETMVFKAKKSKNKCCPYKMKSGSNIDCETYNTADDAKEGHYKLCLKWAKK